MLKRARFLVFVDSAVRTDFIRSASLNYRIFVQIERIVISTRSKFFHRKGEKLQMMFTVFVARHCKIFSRN